MKVGIIIQARVGSSRLPGKVLKTINDKTVLEYGVERLKKTNEFVVVATTTNPEDEKIVELCEDKGIPVFRGSELDVLERYYECAKFYELDIIVRATSDNPLIDPVVVIEGIKMFSEMPENSYVSNCLERTFPHGFNFEVFSFSSLENAFRNAKEGFQREHVTPFILSADTNVGVSFGHIKCNKDYTNFRLTVDMPEDWDLMKIMISKYGADKLSSLEIIEVLEANPELVKINNKIEQIKVY